MASIKNFAWALRYEARNLAHDIRHAVRIGFREFRYCRNVRLYGPDKTPF